MWARDLNPSYPCSLKFCMVDRLTRIRSIPGLPPHSNFPSLSEWCNSQIFLIYHTGNFLNRKMLTPKFSYQKNFDPQIFDLHFLYPNFFGQKYFGPPFFYGKNLISLTPQIFDHQSFTQMFLILYFAQKLFSLKFLVWFYLAKC